MMDIQKRIDRIVRHLPENKIYFLGYIWPADRIEPIRKIEDIRHPTIRECIEHILGISLWFFVDFPPDLKKGIGVKEILARFEEMATKGLSQPTDRVLSFLHIIDRKTSTPEPAKKLENHFDTHKKQDLRILVGLVLQIYDDITKDIHIGSLPAGKDETIPRQAFLEWLNEYMPGDENSENQSQKNDPMGDLVEYLLATDQGKMKTNDVIQLLESKNIRFDFPNMPKKEKKNMVNELRGIGLSKRIVALILDWQRIKSKEVKLNSTMRRL